MDNKFGLFCYTGKQGKGKTYSAVNFCTKQKLQNDYIILTNVKSFVSTFNDTIYFESIQQIIDYCTSFKDNDKNVISSIINLMILPFLLYVALLIKS